SPSLGSIRYTSRAIEGYINTAALPGEEYIRLYLLITYRGPYLGVRSTLYILPGVLPSSRPSTPLITPYSTASRFLSSISNRLSYKRPYISPPLTNLPLYLYIDSSKGVTEDSIPFTPK
ncbi:hypothetical protein N7527_008683, partial [Penicillium freii]